jgi:hypothetical protein
MCSPGFRSKHVGEITFLEISVTIRFVARTFFFWLLFMSYWSSVQSALLVNHWFKYTVKKVYEFPVSSRDVTKPNSSWAGIIQL